MKKVSAFVCPRFSDRSAGRLVKQETRLHSLTQYLIRRLRPVPSNKAKKIRRR